jgi:hypothetical protein
VQASAHERARGFCECVLISIERVDVVDGTKPNRQEIDRQAQAIKLTMPHTYAAIQRKAGEIGRSAFALVRRGLGGEPNCFWAMEAGHVVGTPFAAGHPINAAVAEAMVSFGACWVVIWPEQATEAQGQHGAQG